MKTSGFRRRSHGCFARVTPWVLLAWCACGSWAWGFDSRYHDFILGQRATGMGGAFTAVANDPSASFYNPAGFVGFERLKIGINMTLHGFEYRYATGGLARDAGGEALERLEFVMFPSATGVASRFGGKDKKGRPLWGGGFSFLVPSRTQLRFREGFSELLGTRRRRATLTLHRDGQVFLAGPSIARRFGPFSIGISAFYAHRFFSWLLSNNVSLGECKPGNLKECTTEQGSGAISSVEGWVGGLNFRLGMMFEASPQWTFGLTASFSSIRLWGDGRFLSHNFGIDKDPQGRSSSKFVEQGGLVSHSPMPWEFRLGVAYRPNKSLLLALDLAIYLPSEYALLDSEAVLDLFQYPRLIKRNIVINAHFGGEWMITPRVPFRFGLFTNFSSAPDVPKESLSPFLSKVHMFGVSSSIGVGFGNTTFNFGASVSYGAGDFQRLQQTAQVAYERIPLRHVFIYLYLSGATEFLGYGIQKILDTAGKGLPLGKPKPRKAPDRR